MNSGVFFLFSWLVWVLLLFILMKFRKLECVSTSILPDFYFIIYIPTPNPQCHAFEHQDVLSSHSYLLPDCYTPKQSPKTTEELIYSS